MKSASVNLMTAQANVSFDASATGPRDIIQCGVCGTPSLSRVARAVGAVGFTASLDEGRGARRSTNAHDDVTLWKQHLFLALVFAVPLTVAMAVNMVRADCTGRHITQHRQCPTRCPIRPCG